MIWPRGRKGRPPGLGRRLCDSAVRQARLPALYTAMGAPDTVEGRFELMTLHVILLIEALRQLGPEAAQSSQALFDAYLADLDGALREMGVGDLVVGKRMQALGRVFYGRAAAYRAALSDSANRSDLESLIRRTIFAESDSANEVVLADYVITCRSALAHQGRGLLEGAVWPQP